jgi:hypothetical protein
MKALNSDLLLFGGCKKYFDCYYFTGSLLSLEARLKIEFLLLPELTGISLY